MSEVSKQEQQTLEAVIQRLKAIGVKQIKEDTHLDIRKIEDILEKRFERLDYVRAKGFINIIEKQYRVNLSAWLEEYHLAYPQEEQQPVCEEKKERDLTSLLENKSLIRLASFVGVVVIVVVCFVFLWKTEEKEKTNTLPKQEQVAPKEKLQEKGVEAQNTQNPDSISTQTQQEPSNPSEQETKQISKETKQEEANQEKNSQKEESKEEETVKEMQQEANKQAASSLKAEGTIEDKDPSEYGVSVFKEFSFDPENVLFLDTKVPVWVGHINPETKKRNANIKKEFEIPLDGYVLINVARGRFTLTLNGEEVYYPGYKSIYFVHTPKGGLRQVSKEEFLHLNGGREW